MSAQVAHFTKFIVRFRDAGAGPVDCSFNACGGDVVGSWTIASACADKSVDAGSSNPFGAACPDAVFDVSIDASGTATFGADMSFDLVLTGTPAISVTVPSSCLTNGSLPFPDCATLASSLDKNGGVTCTGDKTTGCNCTGTMNSSGPVNQHQTGTYTVSGTTLTTTTVGDGGSVGDPAPYCVSGTSLKVKSKDGTVINATKK